MPYLLLITLFCFIFIIVYMWYTTRHLRSFPSSEILPLDTNEDKLLSKWYASIITPEIKFDLDEKEIAQKYLEQVHDLNINESLLVMGHDLESQYHKLTNKVLPEMISSDDDGYIDLRNTLAIDGQIAIIHNPKILNELRRHNTYDASLLDSILNNNLGKIAKDFLEQNLVHRWNRIKESPHLNPLNSSGSYLYLPQPINKVSGLPTTKGIRINLLCSDLEFHTFITRSEETNNALMII